MPITLLLADDSVVIQKLVGLSFANEDIEIITVDNGDDAVSRANECKPDLILADVVMPGMNGYEVCAAIRSNPELASTPVLLLTGTFEAFDEGRADEVGATGHITKPFEAQALVDRVTGILAERLAQQRPAAAEAVSPSADSDFFDDNLGDLAESAPESPVPPVSRPPEDFAFGGSENQPLSTPLDDVRAQTAALDSGSDLNDLLDGAGGDRTVAIMPEMLAEDLVATTPPLEASDDSAPLPMTNPDQTMLVDDFPDKPLDSPDPIAGELPVEPPMDHSGTASGAMNLDGTAPPPAAPALDSAPESPEAGDASLALDALGFGDPPAVPAVDSDAPSGDETMLAEDLFADGPDLSSSLDEALSDPTSPQLPASEGLDTVFGGADFGAAPAGRSIVPDNANDYDVSASDLKVDPLGEDPSWSAGVPAGVQTGPEPISSAPSVTEGADRPAPESETSPSIGVATSPVATSTVATSTTAPRPDLTPAMRDRIHDTLEKVAWEAFSDLSDDIVRQLMQRVEQIAWEIIPQMAETLIRDEIRRMKGDEGEQ
jgi:CheY-like chemotaxis protein